MAIQTVRDIVAAFTEGRWHQQRFLKNAGQIADTRWQDWSYTSGQPAYDARVGSPLVFTPAIAAGNDAIFLPPIPSGQQRRLAGFEFAQRASNSGQVGVDYVLYDLIGYYPLIDGDSTDVQAMDNAATLPRYTDGVSVRVVVVNHIAPMLANATGTLVYVDDQDVEQTVTFEVNAGGVSQVVSGVSTSAGVGILALPLASGSRGVKQVVSVQFGTAPGGLFCLYLVKTLATAATWRDLYTSALTSGEAAGFEKCLCTTNGYHLPVIPDGASLAFFYRPSAGGRTVSLLFGQMTFIWG